MNKLKKSLIIGSSTGIGLALAKLSKQLGYTVIATCRSTSEELKQNSNHILENLDLLSPKSP